jgi:hypothetical protein
MKGAAGRCFFFGKKTQNAKNQRTWNGALVVRLIG